MTLPSSLTEIKAIAAKWFQDPAVVSVNIETAWPVAPLVTVTRDMEVKVAVIEG